jgi:hypothetical protein
MKREVVLATVVLVLDVVLEVLKLIDLRKYQDKGRSRHEHKRKWPVPRR